MGRSNAMFDERHWYLVEDGASCHTSTQSLGALFEICRIQKRGCNPSDPDDMVWISARVYWLSRVFFFESYVNGAGRWKASNSTADFRGQNNNTTWVRDGNQDSISLERRQRTAFQSGRRKRTKMETDFDSKMLLKSNAGGCSCRIREASDNHA
jgi:hypothetical protein